MVRLLHWLLLFLLCFPALAGAQQFAPGCARGIGVAGGVAVAERDWDFTTPKPITLAGTPVLTVICMGIAPGGSVTWFGADLMPLYLHSYALIGRRMPLLIVANWGRGIRFQGGYAGVQVVTNMVTFGLGLRGGMQNKYREGGRWSGWDFAFNVYAGIEPDFQLVISHVGWRGIRRTRIERKHKNKIGAGFDISPVLTLRAALRLAKGDYPAQLALRIGASSFPFTNILLQPTSLIDFMFAPAPGAHINFNRTHWYFKLAFDAGVTLQNGAPVPVAGGAVVFDGENRQVMLRLGALAGPDYVTADAGLSFVYW